MGEQLLSIPPAEGEWVAAPQQGEGCSPRGDPVGCKGLCSPLPSVWDPWGFSSPLPSLFPFCISKLGGKEEAKATNDFFFHFAATNPSRPVRRKSRGEKWGALGMVCPP